jgi:hypothetical protein
LPLGPLMWMRVIQSFPSYTWEYSKVSRDKQKNKVKVHLCPLY